MQTAVGLGAVRDYKRAGDGDTGPLTAGMGACAPSPDLTAEEEEAIMRLVLPRDPLAAPPSLSSFELHYRDRSQLARDHITDC